MTKPHAGRAAATCRPARTSLLGIPRAIRRCPAGVPIRSWSGKLVGTKDVSSGALEQYRKLAATLHHAQDERGIKVVMTASALPGEGKTLTAANLALTLSESYQRRVLLIDADLRRPTRAAHLRRRHDRRPERGLKAEHDRPMALTRRVASGCAVLPAGRPDPDPMSGLTSDRMQRV